jgi:hypothetical protein
MKLFYLLFAVAFALQAAEADVHYGLRQRDAPTRIRGSKLRLLVDSEDPCEPPADDDETISNDPIDGDRQGDDDGPGIPGIGLDDDEVDEHELSPSNDPPGTSPHRLRDN